MRKFFIVTVLMLLCLNLSFVKIFADSSTVVTEYWIEVDKADSSAQLYSGKPTDAAQGDLRSLGKRSDAGLLSNNSSAANIVTGDFVLVDESSCLNSSPPYCEISGYQFYPNGKAVKYVGQYHGFTPSEERKIFEQTEGFWEKTGDTTFTVRWVAPKGQKLTNKISIDHIHKNQDDSYSWGK